MKRCEICGATDARPSDVRGQRLHLCGQCREAFDDRDLALLQIGGVEQPEPAEDYR